MQATKVIKMQTYDFKTFLLQGNQCTTMPLQCITSSTQQSVE